MGTGHPPFIPLQGWNTLISTLPQQIYHNNPPDVVVTYLIGATVLILMDLHLFLTWTVPCCNWP